MTKDLLIEKASTFITDAYFDCIEAVYRNGKCIFGRKALIDMFIRDMR